MNTARIVIRGETWLTLPTVAACYEVEIRWVQEVFDRGLLGPGERVEDSVAIPATLLDRIAMIRRLQLQQGLDLAAIAFTLAWREAGPVRE